jgi:3-oxoacyl-[acyl-carrier protein] reductase
MLLQRKTAVITGCNRGIGKKILEVFSENGANIFACVRKIDEQFLSLINSLSKKKKIKIFPFEINFEDSESTKETAKLILQQNVPIDILINNAAIIENSLFQMTSIKNLKKIFEVNFFSQSIFTQFILKSMTKNRNGSIVYISSSSAMDGNIGRNAYSSSKAALISQAITLSREVGSLGIRVNTIAPGLTDTDMMQQNTPFNIKKEVISKLSLKRVGKPIDIANVALFLSSDLSDYITGQTIRADGGM